MSAATLRPAPAPVRLGSWLRGQWRRDRQLVIWIAVFAVLVLVVLLLPLALPDPDAQSPLDRLQGPSAAHLLGTDNYGRDLLSRTLNGGRVSLLIGAIVTITTIVLGTALGLVAGYYRYASSVLMRVMDALMAFPVIVLGTALVVVLGSGAGISGVVIALTVVLTPFVARIVRSRTVALSERGYVVTARAGGVSGPRILLVHVLPNALPTIFVQTAFVYASAVLADASLSFLGLGVAPPTATWGNMISEARPYMTSVPLFMIAPGLMIVLTVMAFNMIGDGLRVLIDPRATAISRLQALRRRAAAAARRRSRTMPEGSAG